MKCLFLFLVKCFYLVITAMISKVFQRRFLKSEIFLRKQDAWQKSDKFVTILRHHYDYTDKILGAPGALTPTNVSLAHSHSHLHAHTHTLTYSHTHLHAHTHCSSLSSLFLSSRKWVKMICCVVVMVFFKKIISNYETSII